MQAQLAAGTVRALAVAAPQRLSALPAVPTFDEAGLPGYDVTNWFGVLAPKGTPREAVVTMNRLITRMAEDPLVVQRFATSGILPMKEPITELTLETPAGLVYLTCRCEKGKVPLTEAAPQVPSTSGRMCMAAA